MEQAEWSTLIGRDPSRYCALIGWALRRNTHAQPTYLKVDMNLEYTTLTAGWLATQYNEKGFVKSLPRLRMEMKRHACSKFTNSKGDIVSKLLLLQ